MGLTRRASLALTLFLAAACTKSVRPTIGRNAAMPQQVPIHDCGDYCDFVNNPCDPASGCTCAYMSSTCQPTYNWCTTDDECQNTLMDPGAHCVNNACWGSGTDCQSQQCEAGNGCVNDQDCIAKWTCSTGNGVCLPPQAAPCAGSPPGFTWDPNYPIGDGTGGCVPPASWPAATNCHTSQDMPGCLLCDTMPWQSQNNCPKIGDSVTYLYPWQGKFVCCIDSPY